MLKDQNFIDTNVLKNQRVFFILFLELLVLVLNERHHRIICFLV